MGTATGSAFTGRCPTDIGRLSTSPGACSAQRGFEHCYGPEPRRHIVELAARQIMNTAGAAVLATTRLAQLQRGPIDRLCVLESGRGNADSAGLLVVHGKTERLLPSLERARALATEVSLVAQHKQRQHGYHCV